MPWEWCIVGLVLVCHMLIYMRMLSAPTYSRLFEFPSTLIGGLCPTCYLCYRYSSVHLLNKRCIHFPILRWQTCRFDDFSYIAILSRSSAIFLDASIYYSRLLASTLPLLITITFRQLICLSLVKKFFKIFAPLIHNFLWFTWQNSFLVSVV